MGCDVHPIIQHRMWSDKASDTWWSRLIPNDGRFYLFFGTLAGVRSDEIPPICEPRGLPNGFYDEAFLSGEHTPSWFTLREAKEYVKTLPQSDEDYYHALRKRWQEWIVDMEYVKKYADDPIGDDDVRVVFDFDS